MLLNIKSSNPHLLDVLNRNPETDFGLYMCALKNGYIAGNCLSANEYEAVFQDTKYSYIPEGSNAIDYQSYCSPLAVMHVCNELFGHILKSRADYADKPIRWLGKTQGETDCEPCTIEVPSFYIDSNWLRNGRFLLCRYFEGLELTPQRSSRIFTLKITAPTVFEAFNMLILTAIFAHVTNEYSVFLYIDDRLLDKYARILTNIPHVPYFVFYLFIMRAVKSPKQFAAVKPVFEEYLANEGLTANLVLEGTSRLRQMYLLALLEKDVPVLDIGCGEFIYYKKLMDKGFAAPYYAVDKEEDYERLAGVIARRYDADNLEFYTYLDECTPPADVTLNILLTEVIEHNTLEEAKALIKKALTYNFNKILITTPNIEFNVHYSMEEHSTTDTPLRHADHCFELTRAEFEAMLTECCQDLPVAIKYFHLGDSLNGVQPIQGAVLTRKDART